MTPSTRFVVAVHVLTLIAYLEDEPVKSEDAAGSANTNPVVIRRITSALSKAGLVTTQPGALGGSKLTRQPEHINLLEVYRAVETSDFFAMHSQPPNSSCLVGSGIQAALADTLDEAQRALEEVLANTTLAQVLETLKAIPHRKRQLSIISKETI